MAKEKQAHQNSSVSDVFGLLRAFIGVGVPEFEIDERPNETTNGVV